MAPLVVQAKPKTKSDFQARFVPGWYIVQQGAEYTPLILAVSDIQADSTHGQMAAQMVTLRPGEAVFAIENSRGTYLVYEWFGRMSAVRGLPDCFARHRRARNDSAAGKRRRQAAPCRAAALSRVTLPVLPALPVLSALTTPAPATPRRSTPPRRRRVPR